MKWKSSLGATVRRIRGKMRKNGKCKMATHAEPRRERCGMNTWNRTWWTDDEMRDVGDERAEGWVDMDDKTRGPREMVMDGDAWICSRNARWVEDGGGRVDEYPEREMRSDEMPERMDGE
jgi:hypothetical protein